MRCALSRRVGVANLLRASLAATDILFVRSSSSRVLPFLFGASFGGFARAAVVRETGTLSFNVSACEKRAAWRKPHTRSLAVV